MKKFYALVFYTLPALAFAQDTCSGLICNPIGHLKTSDGESVTTIVDFIDLALQFMIMLAIPIVAIFIIWSGYNFATAQGDPKKLEKARKSITYIIIGFVVLLLSKGIQMTIQSTIDTLK